ncbi:hypothetical protein [Gordonia sp. NB41Y]|uniref:hypothetical protein n=1 Tax=Gordonia sp. NB41Y TaxID=875808 RepID=UPI00128FA8A7|nr:hypothetical protein [Gordonia sp. NB41Y]WLP90269.1 hypothetical protein Q9K23_22590 [Gordonia sp. NB41Y]
MGYLLRRSWATQTDPSSWEKPVNQASKWLVAQSGTQRIAAEGGSATLASSDSRNFALSVWVGDGGVATVNGASGSNSMQISRSGSTVSVTIRPNTSSAATKTFTTTMPSDRWANVYIQAEPYLVIQVKLTAMVDFGSRETVVQTSWIAGDHFAANGKTLACNSLSGWAWFGSVTGGFFGWGATSTVPIDDAKYREAQINNATWDLLSPGTSWTRPDGLRYARAWVIQGGGGRGGNGAAGRSGGTGGRGGNGYTGAAGNLANHGDGGRGGWGGYGTAGGDGGQGGNNGSAGSAGSSGSSGRSNGVVGGGATTNAGGTGGAGGSGGQGSGGAGGQGGRGLVEVAIILRASDTVTGGTAGTVGAAGAAAGGSDGATGAVGTAGTAASKDGGPGGAGGDATGSGGGNGGVGGYGGHTSFSGVSSGTGGNVSAASIQFGATSFTHGLGAGGVGSTPAQAGGVVLYYQW